MFDFEIAQFFYNMSKLLSIFEDNKYRTIAYYNAAMAIDSYDVYITKLYNTGQIQTIGSIGQSIERQIGEIIETGELVQLKQLERQYNVETYDLLLYHGLSDQLKKKLHINGIKTIDSLTKVFHDSSKFSYLTSGELEKISFIVNTKKNQPRKYLYSQAYCLGQELIEYLIKEFKLEEENNFTSICFSDSMSISNDKIEIIEIFIKESISVKKLVSILKRNPRIKNIVSSNPTTARGDTLFGIPFAIFIQNNTDTRKTCFNHNLKFNLRGDLHAHSTDSDGISDVHTLLKGAKELGLEYFALTDHSKTLKISHGLTETEAIRQISMIREINKNSDIKILSGIEVEILEDGTLDFSDDVLAQFDFVVAGMHTHLGQKASLFIKSRLEKALSNPYVDILAHPTTRLLGRPGNCFSERDGLPIPVEEIIELCYVYNVAIEINCFPERFDFNVSSIKMAAERGVKFSIGTDSHAVSHLNCIHYGNMLAKEAGLTENQILNSYTYSQIIKYFKKNRKKLSVRTFTPKDFSYYFSNNANIMNGDCKIVGIDLTGSESKPSGWALLTGSNASTQTINTNKELLDATLAVKPDIVSIDSPLSLPEGRCCTKEDCSCSQYGITRYCERMLMKFGIGVYPCLIPSMVNLTTRGIYLASLLRSQGLTVIESYPGVAQDVLNIARKRKGLDHLITGLSSFGIDGNYTKKIVSHDELDAITSALVGYFYINNQYVGMGNSKENYLIIPRPQTDYLNKRIIIGLCGEIAAGKTTLAEYLKFKYGFETRRYSEILCNMLGKKQYERKALQELGLKIAKDPIKQRDLSHRIIKSMDKDKSYVIDGLRHHEDFEELSKEFGNEFIFININADFNRRYKRYSEQKNEESIENFAKIDGHGSESDIKKISVCANKNITNNKGYSDFFRQIENILIFYSDKINREVNK